MAKIPVITVLQILKVNLTDLESLMYVSAWTIENSENKRAMMMHVLANQWSIFKEP